MSEQHTSASGRDAVTIADAVAILCGADAELALPQFHPRYENRRDSRVEFSPSRREVYSYGRHFPLLHFVPANTRGRHPALFVLNGDVWRGSRISRTAGHQSAAREAVEASGSASLIIPFSALEGARIDLDSIRPVHVRADKRWTDYLELADDAPDLDALDTADADETGSSGGSYRRYIWRRTSGEYTRLIWDDGAEGHSYLDGNFELIRRADGWRRKLDQHRLGDSLFSAERAETVTGRPFPGESALAAAVRLDDKGALAPRECADNPFGETNADGLALSDAAGRPSYGPHIADETRAACVFCKRPLLDITETVTRRGRYLSSFDLNENPPLYFLAEVPRGAGDTVESALDALAPPAVHAAIARGKVPTRQGDVFFIPTSLTDAEITARAVARARLTQWTVDATARPEEVGYIARETAADRHRISRMARKVWRENFRAAVAQATAHGLTDEYLAANAERREASRTQWAELLARHARERELGREVCEREAARRFPGMAPVSQWGEVLEPCQTCGAGLGMPCETDPLPHGTEWTRGIDAGGHCAAIRNGYRKTLSARHERELDELRRDTRAPSMSHASGAPFSTADNNRDARTRRIRATRDVIKARAELRTATLRGPVQTRGSRIYGRSALTSARVNHARAVARARENLERELEYLRACELSARGNGARDTYRRLYGTSASGAWTSAVTAARTRYRPSDVPGTGAHMKRRELVRDTLAVYGTAHTAREVVRTKGGAVYVRGYVRHVPEIAGETRDADHRRTELTAGVWYLAIRNRVPRQTSRRQRRKGRAHSGV